MSMQGDFVGLVFSSRNEAHKAHLTTNVYARHMALGDFYGAVIDMVDRFAETWAGRYSIIPDINLEFESPDEGMESEGEGDGLSDNSDNIIETLAAHLAWIERNRNSIAPPSDSTLQNILDELISLYLHTLYKLKHLV